MEDEDATGLPVVRIERAVAGGVGLGHLADGRVALVEGALPGELVSVESVADRRDHLRGRVAVVLENGPGRRHPPCAHVAAGCGGCDLQHASGDAQRAMKLEIVTDALARGGGVADPHVTAAPALPEVGYRTTMRLAVHEGRAGHRARGSHRVVAVDPCLVAHPLLGDLISAGRYAGAGEVLLRVGARTAERLVVPDRAVASVEVPDDVVVAQRRDPRAVVHEIVGGRRFRVSAESFFQPGVEAAEVLSAVVVGAVEGALVDGSHVADLYGGVGLFSGAVADRAAAAGAAVKVTLVEKARSAVADARVNLRDTVTDVERSDVERWAVQPCDAVVVDPARRGLGKGGVAVVTATGARRVVLVSCDAGSLGRDGALLLAAGYHHETSTVVDAFPQTTHVEVVTTFRR